MCLNYYGLDPAYYITLPNYSWNAFLSLELDFNKSI